ncbi:FtsX-like permease family protein [compost metagenome]
MKAVWMLCWSFLRKKKLQNGLISILIMLATLLLTTAVLVIVNTGNIYSEMHKKTNGAHQILTMGEKYHDPVKVHEWWNHHEEVQASELMPYRNLSGIFFEGKEVANQFLFMMKTGVQPMAVDELTFAEGVETQLPQEGTVWISTSLAYSKGISVGDNLGFKTGYHDIKLTVSAIVIDLSFGAPFSTNSRIWMNPEDYDEEFASLSGKDQYMMGLRFDNYDNNTAIWKEFEQYLGTPYLETKREFEDLSAFYLIINKIIGFVMVFLGVVMMLVALSTIGFTISDTIIANYRSIGVFKSLGLSSARTISTYIIQYAIVTIVSIVPGVLVSFLLSGIIVSSSMTYLKSETSWIPEGGIPIGWSVGNFIIILVLLFVWLYANKTRNIEPVQAIRYGMSEEDNSKWTRRLHSSRRSSRLGLGRLPIILVIAWRNIRKNRRGSIVMLTLTTITSSVLVLGYVLLSSVMNTGQTAPQWGYDDSHAAATIFNKSEFSEENFNRDLLADSRVETIGWIGEKIGVLPLEQSHQQGGYSSLNIYVSVLRGSYDTFGFSVLEGRNPRNRNEIALGMNVARRLGVVPGDVTDVYLDGKKRTLMVSGIYQAIANMSYSARITADVVTSNPSDYSDADIVLINLHEKSEVDTLVQELNEKYKKSLTVVTQQTLLDSVYSEATSVLMLPFIIMGLLFSVVTFLIIYSICRIEIRKESKTYGIYKSLGLTSRKIRWSITSGIVILSLMGACVGAICGVFVLPLILENILTAYGIKELPLVFGGGGILAVMFISILSATFGSWLSSKIIGNTSPRILVVE